MNVLLIAPRRESLRDVYRSIKAKSGSDKLMWCSGIRDGLAQQLDSGCLRLNRVDLRKWCEVPHEVKIGDIDIAVIDQSFAPQGTLIDFDGSTQGTQLVEALTARGIVCIGLSLGGACHDVLTDAGAVMTVAHEHVEKRFASMLHEARRMVRDNTANPGELLALTLRQPWAMAVLVGGRDMENRSWPARVRGTIAIHVAKDQTRNSYATSARAVRQALKKTGFTEVVVPEQDKLPRGAIIGLVDIVDCVETSTSAWWEGPFGFKLANPRVLPTPIPVNGKRRFWRVPKAVVTKIRRQLMETGQPVHI